LGIIIFFRSSWYSHDINRRGRRVNKPWIEKTSTEDLKNSEFGLRPGGQDAVSLYVLACKIFANFPNTEVMRF
jgi:hypothetical protein